MQPNHIIKRGFYWQAMKKDIRNFVAECNICQQNKFETTAHLGLLQPLHIPQKVGTNINIGFIVGLPKCEGRSVYFVALSCPYTAGNGAQMFIILIMCSNPYTAGSGAQIFILLIMCSNSMDCRVSL